MSSPTYPRSGRGGELQSWIVKCPTPGDNASVQIPCKSPHYKAGISRGIDPSTTRVASNLEYTWKKKKSGVYWRQHKETPNVRSTTGLQNTFLMFYKCFYPGTILSDNLLLIPTYCPTWGRWGLTLTGALLYFNLLYFTLLYFTYLLYFT